MCYCYKVVLDNFFESRCACWKEELLSDNEILSPEKGVAPRPWDIDFTIKPFFQDHSDTKHIPFTDVIKTCSSCCGQIFFYHYYH